MVPDWRNGGPVPLDGEACPKPEHSAQPRPTTGSRKRKAYMPRNSGYDEAAGSSSHEQQQLNCKKRATGTKAARAATRKPTEACRLPGHTTAGPVAAPMIHTTAHSTDSHPSSPAAGSSKAHSMSPRPVAVAQRCGSGSSSAAPAPATAAAQAPDAAVESLATTRSRRVIKRREKFDPHMFELSGDLDEAEESRSDNSSETLSRRSCYRKSASDGGALVRAPTSDSAAASGGVPSPRAWLSALVSGMPKSGGGRANESSTGTSDEQRMFQEFRKRTCTAYTGVVVHCQNMKLEARVNMVSYFPQRERKISGGQIYIAYMTNPHQAAVVHDITASIMTAPGIPIYHNHHCRPSTNREVALERLNYLDTLEVNMHRGYSRNNDKDQLLEKKARLDAENRRQVMLPPEALQRELHCWVSHDSRWLTFKSWIEDVLFESKLANMCLKPKTIDSQYLKPEEQELLRHWAPEFSMSNPPVFTHMYDTLVMDRVTDASGNLCGYKLRAKRYRRRKPEVRNGAVKWFDDKSYRCDLEDPPTEEDQQRVDIAWGVVCRWLRHYDPALQGPAPDYDAVDANYYVTWGHFADWVNTLLEHMPQEIEAVQNDAACATPDRSTSTRRSARNGDSQALKDRIKRLQAVHDKFRGVVAEGESMPSTWSQAKPEHRRAFENFFSGWKPLPPSMSQLQRRAPTRAGGDCGYRGSRRAASARHDTAPQTRAASASGPPTRRGNSPSAAMLPSSSTFTHATAAATGTASTHTATLDPYATPTSPVLPPESTRPPTGAVNGASLALHAAANASTALQQGSISQSVALPHPLLPWSSPAPQDAHMHAVSPPMQHTESSRAASMPVSAADKQSNSLRSEPGEYPRLTVAGLTGISSGTDAAAAASPGAACAASQAPSLPQQKLDVASGVLASMSGINDVAGLQAWATMHGLSSAVPAVLAAQEASNQPAMHSAPQGAAAPPGSAVCSTPAQGSAAMSMPPAAVGGPSMPMCNLQHLMRLQAHLESQHKPEQLTQQQAPKGTLSDALAALNLPSGLLSSQPLQLSQASSAAAVLSAPAPTICPRTAPPPSMPAQLAPRPLVFPPSPFLTALENPTKQASADSLLFQGAPPMPPLTLCSLSDRANSSVNDSARSCKTGSSGVCHGLGFTASGSGKSFSSTSGSGAVLEASNSPATATAVRHPTLSGLLSNPLFALPTATQAARAGSSKAGPPTFAPQFSSGK